MKKTKKIKPIGITNFKHWFGQYRTSTLLYALADSRDQHTLTRLEKKNEICNKMSKVPVEQQYTYREQLSQLGSDEEFILSHPELNNFMGLDNQTLLNNCIHPKVMESLMWLKLMGLMNRLAHKECVINNEIIERVSKLKRELKHLGQLITSYSDGAMQLAPGITDPHSFGGPGWFSIDVTPHEEWLEELYRRYMEGIDWLNNGYDKELNQKMYVIKENETD